ncbi:transposable element Tc1 transposase [Trichonephila clavipes]|nr:transposable element Tc1 transposase [Trichonephila clavipes]
MDDNARTHRTLAVEELLESKDITRMDQPAYSPDLNPIEHVWNVLGRRIAARLHHPENTQQLKQILIEEWALLPQEMLHQLVLSIRRRCEATITIDRFWEVQHEHKFHHMPLYDQKVGFLVYNVHYWSTLLSSGGKFEAIYIQYIECICGSIIQEGKVQQLFPKECYKCPNINPNQGSQLHVTFTPDRDVSRGQFDLGPSWLHPSHLICQCAITCCGESSSLMRIETTLTSSRSAVECF